MKVLENIRKEDSANLILKGHKEDKMSKEKHLVTCLIDLRKSAKKQYQQKRKRAQEGESISESNKKQPGKFRELLID